MFESIATGEDPEAIVSFLESLPPEREHGWELHLTKLIETAPDCRRTLRSILNDEASPESVRFGAFFACCIYHRRQGNVTQFGMLLREYAEFDDHPLFPHLQGLHQSQLSSPGSGHRAIEFAREAAQRVGAHPGVRHSLAIAIVEHLEQEPSESAQELLEEAHENVTTAIERIEYPRYFDTLGRILTHQGKYDDARANIHKAIDLEDEAKEDYAIRIGMYRSHEFRVILEEHAADISNEQQTIRTQQRELGEKVSGAVAQLEHASEQSEERMREIQTQTLQFMAFFATMLAVIVSSITVTTRFPVPDAAALILVLTGGLLAAFGGFTIVLPIDRVRTKAAALFGMGTLIAGAGIGVILSL